MGGCGNQIECRAPDQHAINLVAGATAGEMVVDGNAQAGCIARWESAEDGTVTVGCKTDGTSGSQHDAHSIW